MNGYDVRFASELGASSGNLNIGDTTITYDGGGNMTSLPPYKTVRFGGNYSTFTGVIGLYNAVTISL